MLRQKTGPATIAANKTWASMPSWSCSRTRCSGPPVPAASATLRPKGCQVPSARPARRSRKLASSRGWPSIIRASPPSGSLTVCGARTRYFSGTRWIQRSGGTSRCPSADISLYCLAILPPLRRRLRHAHAGNIPCSAWAAQCCKPQAKLSPLPIAFHRAALRSEVLPKEMRELGAGNLGAETAPVEIEAMIGGGQQIGLVLHPGAGERGIEKASLIGVDDAVAFTEQRARRRRVGANRAERRRDPIALQIRSGRAAGQLPQHIARVSEAAAVVVADDEIDRAIEVDDRADP